MLWQDIGQVARKVTALAETARGMDLFDETSHMYYLDSHIRLAERRLRNNGSLPYNVLDDDCSMPRLEKAEELKERLREAYEKTGRKQLAVGHSMGGAITRSILDDPHTGAVVILASPHRGARPEHFESLIEHYTPDVKERFKAYELFPGSDYIKELERMPVPRTIVVNFYTSDGHDSMVSEDSAYLEWAVNKPMEGLGHLDYLAHPVVRETIAQLYKETGYDPFYVHGLHNIASAVLEYAFHVPRILTSGLRAVEDRLAYDGFKPIHAALHDATSQYSTNGHRPQLRLMPRAA